MSEPTHTEAVKTELPSRKPNRRRRLALRFAVLVAGVSVLGAAYWFTRPPELVWWRDVELRNSRRKARILVPRGWEQTKDASSLLDVMGATDVILFVPVDRRPTFLRHLFPLQDEDAWLTLGKSDRDLTKGTLTGTVIEGNGTSIHWVWSKQNDRLKHGYFILNYGRSNLPAFNRTYRQICNSLTIE
jgi:hypothetical protein